MTPESVVATVACPCGALMGESCNNNNGNLRLPHNARIAAYKRLGELWTS